MFFFQFAADFDFAALLTLALGLLLAGSRSFRLPTWTKWTSTSDAKGLVPSQASLWQNTTCTDSPPAVLNPAQLEADDDTTNGLGSTMASLRHATEQLEREMARWFNKYHPYDEHGLFLDALEIRYGAHAQNFTVGSSYEGRPIRGIHMWGDSEPGVKPAVVFYGTMHGREWITTMVTEYLAYRILRQYRQDDEVHEALNKYDFYILPLVNPDGFVYSQTTDRWWRKNRQPNGNSTCVGRDLNRNWDIHWGQGLARWVSSTRPCSEIYQGLKPHDAPETAALAGHLGRIRLQQGIQLFINWHSFGQLILYPHEWTCSVGNLLTPDHVIRVAEKAAHAMKAVHGTTYKPGSTCEMLYHTAGGSSEDYVFDRLEAKYAYAIDLRPAYFGSGELWPFWGLWHNFNLPERYIRPTAEEAFAGVKAMLKFMV